MAHFILEYSDNLGLTGESIQHLFAELHDAAEKSGLFPLKGLRSRAYPCSQYRMADGNPQHGFCHMEVKLGAGRTLDERKSVAESFFDIFSRHFSVYSDNRGIALSFEMRELDPVLKFNKNNIIKYL